MRYVKYIELDSSIGLTVGRVYRVISTESKTGPKFYKVVNDNGNVFSYVQERFIPVDWHTFYERYNEAR